MRLRFGAHTDTLPGDHIPLVEANRRPYADPW